MFLFVFVPFSCHFVLDISNIEKSIRKDVEKANEIQVRETHTFLRFEYFADTYSRIVQPLIF